MLPSWRAEAFFCEEHRREEIIFRRAGTLRFREDRHRHGYAEQKGTGKTRCTKRFQQILIS